MAMYGRYIYIYVYIYGIAAHRIALTQKCVALGTWMGEIGSKSSNEGTKRTYPHYWANTGLVQSFGCSRRIRGCKS